MFVQCELNTEKVMCTPSPPKKSMLMCHYNKVILLHTLTYNWTNEDQKNVYVPALCL